MHIRIEDDFDLKKIDNSGQCFRVKRLDKGYYRFTSGENEIYLQEAGERGFSASYNVRE